jgi:hypothetical protein
MINEEKRPEFREKTQVQSHMKLSFSLSVFISSKYTAEIVNDVRLNRTPGSD